MGKCGMRLPVLYLNFCGPRDCQVGISFITAKSFANFKSKTWWDYFPAKSVLAFTMQLYCGLHWAGEGFW